MRIFFFRQGTKNMSKCQLVNRKADGLLPLHNEYFCNMSKHRLWTACGRDAKGKKTSQDLPFICFSFLNLFFNLYFNSFSLPIWTNCIYTKKIMNLNKMTVASLVASEHFQNYCLNPTAQSSQYWGRWKKPKIENFQNNILSTKFILTKYACSQPNIINFKICKQNTISCFWESLINCSALIVRNLEKITYPFKLISLVFNYARYAIVKNYFHWSSFYSWWQVYPISWYSKFTKVKVH